jgi:hypothetical protein
LGALLLFGGFFSHQYEAHSIIPTRLYLVRRSISFV